MSEKRRLTLRQYANLPPHDQARVISTSPLAEGYVLVEFSATADPKVEALCAQGAAINLKNQ
jgi:hypothetical protein